MSSKEIIKDALKLSPQEKLFIVDSILESLDEPDKDIEQTWTKEAEKLKAIPHDAEFIHRVFLYHMRLNGVEIVKAIE